MKPEKDKNTCRNPQNQFIVSHFQALINKNDSRYKQKLALTYFSVIKSVRAYPLPILSGLQIRMLRGGFHVND